MELFILYVMCFVASLVDINLDFDRLIHFMPINSASMTHNRILDVLFFLFFFDDVHRLIISVLGLCVIFISFHSCHFHFDLTLNIADAYGNVNSSKQQKHVN